VAGRGVIPAHGADSGWPGDEVRLVGELLASLAGYDATWLRDTTFVVRYVGDDETIEVQPVVSENYVIESVPIANS
jgi:hypothetical protein